MQKQLPAMIMMVRWPALKEVYHMKEGNFQQKPLVWPIMCDAREKGATDARDKVFALYAVFRELKIAESLPAPDYSKPVEDIYREITIACIESDRQLYVLFEAPSDRRHLRPDLASWVADWSDPGWRGHRTADSRVAVTRDRFCAAGTAQPEWLVSDEGRRLQLQGKIIDEIFVCSNAFSIVVDPYQTVDERLERRPVECSRSDSQRQYLSDLRSAYEMLKTWASVRAWYASDEYPTTGEKIGDAFCRTVSHDVVDLNDHRCNGYNSWFEAMTSAKPDVAVCRAWPKFQQNLFSASLRNDAIVERAIRKIPIESAALAATRMEPGGRFHSHAMVFANRKSFFITSGGRMGTAPARVEGDGRATNLVEAGDRVAVVAGLCMPIVLRPHEGGGDGVYKLITHAYVHGVMYGEAWNEKKRVGDIVLV